MDREKLIEISNRVAELPALEERMEKLCRRLYDAEADVRSLLRKFEEQSRDVEQLKKDTLSVILLKLIGKYEGKLDRETREMLSAKLEYDKACQRAEELRNERYELGKRIAELRREKQIYERELKDRENAIRDNINSEANAKYMQLEKEREELTRQLVETDEALKAAARVKGTIRTVLDHLDSAEKWATYDVWAGKGLLSHIAKYEHIDDAEVAINRLQSQMKDLQKELADVNLFIDPNVGKVDSATRAIDFWFDNIFTDLNVRDKIRGDMKQMEYLAGRIQNIIDRLEKNREEIKRQLSVIEYRKNELIIKG